MQERGKACTGTRTIIIIMRRTSKRRDILQIRRMQSHHHFAAGREEKEHGIREKRRKRSTFSWWCWRREGKWGACIISSKNRCYSLYVAHCVVKSQQAELAVWQTSASPHQPHHHHEKGFLAGERAVAGVVVAGENVLCRRVVSSTSDCFASAFLLLLVDETVGEMCMEKVVLFPCRRKLVDVKLVKTRGIWVNPQLTRSGILVYFVWRKRCW